MFGPVTKCPSDAIAIFQQAGDRAFHVDGDPQLHAAVLQSADHFKARTAAIPLQLLGHGHIASVPFTPCGTKSYSGESCSATLDALGEGVQGRLLISWERARALQVESGPGAASITGQAASMSLRVVQVRLRFVAPGTQQTGLGVITSLRL